MIDEKKRDAQRAQADAMSTAVNDIHGTRANILKERRHPQFLPKILENGRRRFIFHSPPPDLKIVCIDHMVHCSH